MKPKSVDIHDVLVAFDLEPEKAVAYLKAKGYVITFDWKEMLAKADHQAFTVAKVMQLDLLADIHGGLVDAAKEGKPFAQFNKDLKPVLESKGWLGKREVTDPKTGKVATIDLSKPSRMEVIFRTNMQSALMAGRSEQQRATADTKPYMGYIVLIDGRTSPICRVIDPNLVWRTDDPRWETKTPPLHFQCRTRTAVYSAKQVRDLGLVIADGSTPDVTPAPGFDVAPGTPFEPDLSGYPKELAAAYRSAAKKGA